MQADHMLTNALEQQIDIMGTALCRMSAQMKNPEVAAEAAIFCPPLPKAKRVPLPRQRPPDLILAPR